jgi:CDP-diacylglycerol--glycerol-3-phosphate 3-phosphatidyltransferase
MTWANRITIARCLLIPVFVALLLYYDDSVKSGAPREDWRWAALAVFFIAAVSDFIDGYLARHCNQATRLGALLDPIADKCLMAAAIVILSIVQVGAHPPFPIWFPVLIISRDVIELIFYVVLRLLSIAVEIRPHITGKLETTFNFLAVGSALLLWPTTLWFCIAAGVFAVVSGLLYLRQGIALVNQSPHNTGK